MEKILRLVREFVYILFVIIAAILTGCRPYNRFVLDGVVKDGGSGLVYLYVWKNKKFYPAGHVPYVNGRFLYVGRTDQPQLYGISVKENDTDPQSFFAGEDTLHLTFWKTGAEVVTNGSPLNDEYLSMHEKARNATLKQIFHYVAGHRSSPVTAFLVLNEWSWRLSLSDLKVIDNMLETSRENTLYPKQIKDLISRMETVEPGCMVPVVKGLTDNVKQPLVLAFFATWCPDCQAEIPQLARTAAKNRHIRFAGISLDSDSSTVDSFIRRNPTLFKTVQTDTRGWDSPLVRQFAVRWIPTFFLIAPGGRIQCVSRNVAGLHLP